MTLRGSRPARWLGHRGQRGRAHRVLGGVGGDLDPAADLAVDLHRVGDRLGRPAAPGRRPGTSAYASDVVVAQPPPQLLGHVRGERRQHQHQRLGHLARRRRPAAVSPLVSSISLAIAC